MLPCVTSARRLLCTAVAFFVCSCSGVSGPVEGLRGSESELERLTAGPFFLQMSDPQLGFAGTPLIFQLAGWTWSDTPTAKEIALFERAIAHANRLRPAFVVICGDLIQTPGDAEQTAEFLRIAAGLDESIPLHLVAGNHDVGSTPTPESLRWYRETFGPDRYAFQHGDLYGIVLNSSLIDHPESAEADADAQLVWLGEELARARAAQAPHVVIFQHHPFFLVDPDEGKEYFNLPVKRRRAYLEVLRDGGVSAVFAGHYHRNGYARDGDLEMITTGPVGKPLGSDPSGFRIVRISPEGLTQAYFGIADPP
jgi:3',5'-cyclic AMP phosphodiesterase CpdA